MPRWADLGSAITTGTASWSASWVTTTPTAFPDGAYNLRAIVTDTAGNQFTTPSTAVTVKNTFTVSPSVGTKTAGTSFEVTVATYHGYSGPKTLTIGGLSTSPNGSLPTTSVQANFVGGSATISVTAVRVETTSITVTQGGITGSSGNVSVAAATPAALFFTTCSGTAGATFSCTANAPATGSVKTNTRIQTWTVLRVDAYGNPSAPSTTTPVSYSSSPTISGMPTSSTIASGQSAVVYNPGGNAGPQGFSPGQSYTITADSTGLTSATLTLTVSN